MYLPAGLVLAATYAYAQSVSTTTPVPPLQWINLSNLLQGTSRPPPLRDASIGYDETSRSLIIFGGLSESGFPQSQTYLLNLNTLTWSAPSPPANLQRSPPARSSFIFGNDFAASNRHGFLIIGGKGSDGKALSDIWEYDFINQFWSQVQLSPGGPSPRWSASGGIDSRVPFVQDPVVPGPNNTFYLAGGFDGTNISPLSDVWRLNVSGTLSSNLPDSVEASWEHLSIANIPGRVDQASTVVGQNIVSFGGCSSLPTSATNATCALPDSFIINTSGETAISPGPCPAPRVDPALIPNLNTFSAAFASQVFVLLGTLNTTLWQDSGGSTEGEVDILDINTGTWTRVIPSGDPSDPQNEVPTPREGAVAVAFPQGLVGTSRSASSDIIVFGGQDSNGNYLSDLWLLRSYNGSVSPSSPTWSGFGNGQLQTGVNANGAGVNVTYIGQCASVQSSPSSPTSPLPSTPLTIDSRYRVSLLHKILAPLSLALAYPILLLSRWLPSTFSDTWFPAQRITVVTTFTILIVSTYAIGVIGLVLAFTTISLSSPTSSSKLHLATAHGIAGLAFAASLYVLTPLAYLTFACFGRISSSHTDSNDTRNDNFVMNEKSGVASPNLRGSSPSLQPTTPPASPPPRRHSPEVQFSQIRASTDGGMSNESSASQTPHKTGFEVLNRPRARRVSDTWPSHATNGSVRPMSAISGTRRLSDIDWMLRRRSLGVVGELDYMLTQVHNAQVASALSASTPPPNPPAQFPKGRLIVIHILLQLSLLGLAVVSLTILWNQGPRYSFILMLLLSAAFYLVMFIMAWKYYPARSILTVILWRLRQQPMESSSPEPTREGPYLHHRPPHRLANHSDRNSQAGPLGVETDDTDDDLDEESRQRLIEEEMERRDVSIITTPRRKLWVANPS